MLSGTGPPPAEPQPAPIPWVPMARTVDDLATELRAVIAGRPGWTPRGAHPLGVVHAEYRMPARPDGCTPGGSVSGGGVSGWWWTVHDGTARPLAGNTSRLPEWTAVEAVAAVEQATHFAPPPTIGALTMTDHDDHGLVVEVWPDDTQTIDPDCDCPPDCAACDDAGVVRPDTDITLEDR